ncbi:MAG: CoA transferase [Chloroflexi bacterium]|nr:CoA transferase [Chloroflexota bacterium]
MPLPLEGVRVVDLTIVVAGPTATSALADLGAEVIKIEHVNARTTGGARSLPLPPGVEADRPYNRAPGFHELNRGKKAIALNLNRPEAQQAFLGLVRTSDVVIENFSPRVMPNFGFTYEALSAIAPGLIMVSMPALGSTGPYATRTGFGPGIDAMSGLAHLTGFPDGPPVKPGNILCDFNAGMLAAYAVMTALYARSQTGEGQHIELAMREGETLLIGEYLVDATMNGRSPMRDGNRHPSMAPHNVYPCREEDTWVTIAVGSDEEWARLQAAMDDPAWARDTRYDGALGRWQHQEELDRHIAQWTRTQTPYAVMERLQAAGVTSGAVLNARDIAQDPHYTARGFQQVVSSPETGPFKLVRPGYVLSKSPAVLHAGPGFAEHNDYVFRGLLGMSDDEVAQMEKVKATSRRPIQLERV